MAVRGRPRFKPTAVQKRKVSMFVATGFSHDHIAKLIGIARPTLNQYFAEELEWGHVQYRAKLIERLDQQSSRGSKTATKDLLVKVDAEAVPTPAQRAAEPKEKAVGKKETAQAEALTAAEQTSWSGLIN